MAAPHRNRSKPSDAAFEKTREKIKSSQLINALMDHVLEKNNRGDMKPSQVTAALGLLKKRLPDLQATELSGPGGKDLFNDMTSDDLNARIKELESKSKD